MKRVFSEMMDLIQAAGFRVRDFGYDASAFGSWRIELEGEPRLKVVWDGRDDNLSILASTGAAAQSTDAWHPLWRPRDRSEGTPDIVVRKLGELMTRSAQT